MDNKETALATRTGIIYRITSPSGKIYIGQTINRLWDRLRRHITTTRKSAIHDAMTKYGAKSFTADVIMVVSVKSLDTAESMCIALFESITPLGYNLTTGGDHPTIDQDTRDAVGLRLRGKKQSKEVCEKIRLGLLKRYEDPKNIERCRSAALRRWQDPEYRKATIEKVSKPRSEEAKARMRLSCQNPEKKEKQRKALLAIYKDPEQRKKRKEVANSPRLVKMASDRMLLKMSDPIEKEKNEKRLELARQSPLLKKNHKIAMALRHQKWIEKDALMRSNEMEQRK